MDVRTPVIMIGGYPDGARQLGAGLLTPGTVLVRHDLALLRDGVVTRTLTTHDREQTSALELAHGCVSCTLRASLLPLLRTLSDRSSVTRIVLLLDPAMEPIEVCEAIETVVVTGIAGRVDAPAGHDVRVAAMLAAVDAATWLSDATGDETLAERLGTGDDDRTVAQVALAQVEYADAITFFGQPDPLDTAVMNAVFARLTPSVPRHWVSGSPDAAAVLASAGEDSRTGRGFDPHAPLLAGAPPLEMDGGVCLVEFTAQRPFQPERLHEAIDVLLDGVITARGRIWLATRPQDVLWLESAGAGLRIGPAGPWLAALSPTDQQAENPERLAMAALRWHPRFGDRHCALVALVHDADPGDIDRALRWALVTDDELRQPNSWQHWPDPFGDWHEDPCATTESTSISPTREGEQS
ncbi:ribosome hibernation factor-recruiting GTPase MRF [Nocardia arizonensis]|uniref:ribosome hibernation factor-recruiting GTPase MRF n=1 Tax=Nocardia arizonensis TaxID=1141647 RepID=UPI0006D18DB6|nr:GTP-binding protein [Nocardia arizonensis]